MKLSDQLVALGGIFAVVIVGFAIFFWLAPTPGTVQTFTQDRMVKPDSAMTGSTTAKVTLVEWGDFECPACGVLEPVIQQILTAYGKNPDFNFVFRNFPLPQHAHARPAAEASQAAGAQGHFWEMYSLLYENQKDWVDNAQYRTVFDSYAKSLKLDLAKFDAALDAGTYAPLIDRDYQEAGALRLTHTPTLFLNGVEQTDTSLIALTKAIDAALK